MKVYINKVEQKFEISFDPFEAWFLIIIIMTMIF